jgi:DNA-binding NtrC family response regulator
MNGDAKINRENNKGVVILIEPDASVREALSLLLQSEGWSVNCLDQCTELATAILTDDVIAIVSESRLPDCTPQEILEQCKKVGLPVIFTGHDLSLQSAVDLIRQGATDFLDKPFPQGRLLDLLKGM